MYDLSFTRLVFIIQKKAVAMALNFIRFISTILIITFGTHYFLYFSWVRLFQIAPGHSRNSLFGVLAFLSVTFIISSILIHWTHNTFTKLFYLFSGLWVGLLGFLIMATVLLWILKGGLVIFASPAAGTTVINGAAILLYTLALIYTGYCHYQFYTIQIRSIEVPVKNLPLAWENRTIIQLSDLHLGGAKDMNFLDQVVQMTNSLEGDLIVITGDLFDGATGSQEKYIQKLDTLRARHGVMFTSGNHEVYSGIGISRHLIEQSNITLLDNRALVLDGLQVLGISYPTFNGNESFDFNNPEQYSKGYPTVLLYHTPTGIKGANDRLGQVQSSDYLAPDLKFSIAGSNGICLQLSGHTHAGQFFPYTWLADKIFKGYHYGLHKNGDMYINISAGTGSWGPPLRSVHLSEIVVITLVPR
ncbi:MAG: hypothetical protein D3926_12865 [Desulfobacteraceae bacterium]|nr:MAG: hypothetical protein D3926_12865 [Desulfobacteraceae bacterium]